MSALDRPSLILNPPDDPAFEAFVERQVAVSSTDPDATQNRLRQRYPRAIVRPRDLVGESFAIWYVYRDGHWVRPRTAG